MKHYKLLLLTLFLTNLAFASDHSSEDEDLFDKAYEFTQSGKHKEAFVLYNILVKKGHAPSENNLGYMYKSGTFVEKDYKKAFDLYNRSAAKNYIYAQVNLAFMYGTGAGTTLNYDKAFYWYKKAAVQGFPAAQYNVAKFYENGLSVNKNHQTALTYYDKACKNNYIVSCESYKKLKNK